MDCDVLVIGGGMAGCTAALAAAEAGAKTALAGRAPGATSMHSGAFDIDADPFRPRRMSEPETNTLEQNVARTAMHNPLHPYAVLGDAAASLRDSIKFFIAAMAGAGLDISGARGDYLLLGNNLGTLKKARLCLSTMAAGDVSRLEGARLLVLGPEGLDGFDPKFIAASIAKIASRVKPGAFEFCVGEAVPLDGESRCNLSPYRAAEILSRPGYLQEAADAAAKFVKRHAPTHIAFPPIIGLERPAQALRTISQRLGAECFELASSQPSVPGLRIANACEKALRAAGVTLLAGAAEGGLAGAAPSSVTVRLRSEESTEVRAGATVLATGRFLSGGLRGDASLVETVFNLPVFQGCAPARNAFIHSLVSPSFADSQPIFSAGLSAGPDCRALNARGEPAGGALFCAGSIIGGYDPARDRCGSGVAIATGWTAGRAAAAAASRAGA